MNEKEMTAKLVLDMLEIIPTEDALFWSVTAHRIVTMADSWTLHKVAIRQLTSPPNWMKMMNNMMLPVDRDVDDLPSAPCPVDVSTLDTSFRYEFLGVGRTRSWTGCPVWAQHGVLVLNQGQGVRWIPVDKIAEIHRLYGPG